MPCLVAGFKPVSQLFYLQNLNSCESAMKIFIDGKFHGERDAKISVFDHGLRRSSGLIYLARNPTPPTPPAPTK